MDLDLRRLRVFVAVADELHFGRAADRVGLAQPAVSHQISRLEEQLGMRLFERTSRRVELTPEGVALLEEARALLHHGDVVLERLRNASDQDGRLLVVGGPQPVLAALAPAAIRRAAERLPGVSVHLHELRSAQLPEAVRTRQVDVGLTVDTGDDRPDAQSDGLLVTPLREDRWVGVVALDHPVAGQGSATPARLVDRPLAMHSRAWAPAWHDTVTAYCKHHGVSPTLAFEDASMHLRLALVAAGAAVAIMPQHVVRAAAGVRLVRLTPAAEPVQIVALHREDGLTDTVEAFCRIARAALARRAPID